MKGKWEEGKEEEEAILKLWSLHIGYKACYRALLRNFSIIDTSEGEIPDLSENEKKEKKKKKQY
jgi:hypothetical protein